MTEIAKFDYPNEQEEYLVRMGVPFSLRMQPETCKRTANELKAAVSNVRPEAG